MENSENIQSYTALDHLSTHQLEELLRNDLAISESCSVEMVNYIMGVIEKREKNTSENRKEIERAWQEFQELYNTPEGEGRSLYPAEEMEATADNLDNQHIKIPLFTASKHYHLRRTLLAAAVIAIVFFFLVPPALGYNGLREMIGKWTNAVFHFEDLYVSDSFQPDADIETASNMVEKEYFTLEEALSDYGLTEAMVPTRIPEGFVLQDVSVFEQSEWGEIEFSALFKKGDSSLVISMIYHDTPESFNYEKDPTAVEIYTVNGTAFYFFDNLSKKAVTWYKGCFEYSISGEVSIESLKAIINSI